MEHLITVLKTSPSIRPKELAISAIGATGEGIIWALSRENLSSGFPKKRVSNQSHQLQRLARKLKFLICKIMYDTFQKVNNKGADQTAQMRRLVCCCVVRKSPKTGFLASRPISFNTCRTIDNLLWELWLLFD